MSDEVPEWAKLWLDGDVAAWLHEEADRHFDGDVNLAMNQTLRAVMVAARAPADPWALPVARQRARSAGRAQTSPG